MIDYMEASQKPSVKLFTNCGDFFMDMKNINRPRVEQVNRICKNREIGSVTFNDEFIVTMPFPCMAHKAALFYDDEMVAMRAFPPICMNRGDTLDLTFTLMITCDSQGVWI